MLDRPAGFFAGSPGLGCHEVVRNTGGWRVEGGSGVPKVGALAAHWIGYADLVSDMAVGDDVLTSGYRRLAPCRSRLGSPTSERGCFHGNSWLAVRKTGSRRAAHR